MGMSKFGPGTLTLDPAGTGHSFECQIVSGGVTHSYEETQAGVDYLGDGCQSEAQEARIDSLTFTVDHGLYATDLYAFCIDNDLQPVAFEYVPDTNTGTVTPAKWAGTVRVKLPDGVQGDEVGGFLSGSVEWVQAVSGSAGNFAFTAASDA